MDTIGNMLAKIKNAQAVRKPKVELSYSRNREAIAKVLEDHGYLSDVRVYKPKGKSFKMLSLDLRYIGGKPFISQVRKISKPGQRIYSSAEKLPQALGGKGLVVVSTPQGVMSGKEAKKRNLGGEVICEIW